MPAVKAKRVTTGGEFIMNTTIEYLYRDASNYKKWNRVVIRGELSSEQLERIEACLDGDYFVPRSVGLPEHRITDYRTDDDHCWFEWEVCDVAELTEELPTIDMSAEELVRRFEQVSHWDETGWMNDYPYKSYEELGVYD